MEKIFIDDVTKSIIRKISDGIIGEIERHLNEYIKKLIVDELSAMSATIREEIKTFFNSLDKKQGIDYNRISESFNALMDRQLTLYNETGRTFMEETKNDILRAIEQPQGASTPFESNIIEQFLHLYELLQNNEAKNKERYNEVFFIIKRLEESLQNNAPRFSALNNQLKEGADSLANLINSFKDNERTLIGVIKDFMEMSYNNNITKRVEDLLVPIREEIKMTRIIAENEYKEKIEAQNKLKEFQRLWEQQR